MKQSLQLKIGHHLSMTPQLQQAIKLLQLSSVDLNLEIQQALYENPMLELAEEAERAIEKTNKPEREAPETPAKEEWHNEIPDNLPIDAQWDDIYTNSPPTNLRSKANANEVSSPNFEEYHSVTGSLRDHLRWQLNLAPLSEMDHLIGTSIIDNINDDGFLERPIEDIWVSLYDNPDSDFVVELDELIAVLHQIQQFDPAGVAAVDLRECLLIQLNQLIPTTDALDDAKTMVDLYLPCLAEQDYSTITRQSGLSETAVQTALKLIQSLSPRPGEAVSIEDNGYVVPDVTVKKDGDRWHVMLNDELAPRLCINQEYARLVQRANNSADNTFMREHLQEARWFLRSLESRNETLMRVSRSIVDKQTGFLEHGPEAMKPLILADIADLLGLHESTISRITTQKYIQTPRGVYELKYFFSSHIDTASGGECSSTAIRAMVKRIISTEPANKPFSDSKLADMLRSEGIKVARRTVAKYRESLRIPCSSDRKRFKQFA